MERHEFLSILHERIRPRTYVETGIDRGQSLQLSRVPSVGIDPDYAIQAELQADVHLARIGSDEFFARRRPLAHLPIPVVDLAFIDGMHLAEYALRDYLAVERFSHPCSVIVFDDMLPRSVEEANRKRTTRNWTGDVYKAAEALRALRPDTIVLEVDTQPTGVVVVLCPDASRKGVLPGYDDWLEAAVAPDPQAVPEAVLTRSRALAPASLLASPGWERLVALRAEAPGVAAEGVRRAFSHLL
ncbi:class I SAM-dependent methyltransferase [Nocardioides pacificus]